MYGNVGHQIHDVLGIVYVGKPLGKCVSLFLLPFTYFHFSIISLPLQFLGQFELVMRDVKVSQT